MDIFLFATLFVAFISVFATLASIIRWNDWWIRVFDFPRLQVSILLVISLFLAVFSLSFAETWHFIIPALVVVSILYQAYKIYPYTVFAPKKVLSSGSVEPENCLSVLISNVLMTNKQSKRLLDIVKEKSPDLLLTLESNKWWEEELKPLEADFPYNVKVPLENLYGMHLYSRLELINPVIKYRIEKDVPSIETRIKLRTGKTARLFCLHPAPPSPTQNDTSGPRDAELLRVADELDAGPETLLVMGDLNDVAWSRTTTLFLKLSGLLDPRMGRGFFNTFHAGNVLLRWPLDHLFHSNDFKLVNMQRQKNIGSDHFPIYSQIVFQPSAEQRQSTTEAPDADERKHAREKINEPDK